MFYHSLFLSLFPQVPWNDVPVLTQKATEDLSNFKNGDKGPPNFCFSIRAIRTLAINK
jgi:hypothetical protein